MPEGDYCPLRLDSPELETQFSEHPCELVNIYEKKQLMHKIASFYNIIRCPLKAGKTYEAGQYCRV